MIDSKQLYYFVVCADVGSISKASEILYTTQPNVSRVIKQLEQHLNTALFLRSGSGICLTKQGRLIYQYATDILNKMHTIEDISQENQNNRSFGLSATPSRRVACCFSRFVRAMDQLNYNFNYNEGSISQVISDVENYVSDLGIVFIADKQRSVFEYMLYQKQLVFHELMKAELVIQVGPRHPYFHEEALTSEMIQHLKFLILCDSIDSHDFYLKHMKEALKIGSQLNNAITVNSDDVMLQLLLNTDRAYITYHPMEGTFSYLYHKYLRYFSVPCPDGDIWLGYIRRKNNSSNEIIHRFIDFFHGNF